MRKILLACLALAVAEVTCAQSLEKIQWFNEPERWTAEDGILTMQVPPHCDYWRVSHYGFTVDDAPFCYATYGGEFEAKVKVTGDYKTRFDQAGLMLRIDAGNYIKAGVEFVDGKFNLSTVVTHGTSDWSIIPQDGAVPFVWIKAVRRLDAVEIFYSFDDKEYVMMQNAPGYGGAYGCQSRWRGIRSEVRKLFCKTSARYAANGMVEAECRIRRTGWKLARKTGAVRFSRTAPVIYKATIVISAAPAGVRGNRW